MPEIEGGANLVRSSSFRRVRDIARTKLEQISPSQVSMNFHRVLLAEAVPDSVDRLEKIGLTRPGSDGISQ